MLPLISFLMGGLYGYVTYSFVMRTVATGVKTRKVKALLVTISATLLVANVLYGLADFAYGSTLSVAARVTIGLLVNTVLSSTLLILFDTITEDNDEE